MTAAPHSIAVTFRRGRYHAQCQACDWRVSARDEARALYLGGLHSQWLSDPRSQAPRPALRPERGHKFSAHVRL